MQDQTFTGDLLTAATHSAQMDGCDLVDFIHRTNFGKCEYFTSGLEISINGCQATVGSHTFIFEETGSVTLNPSQQWIAALRLNLSIPLAEIVIYQGSSIPSLQQDDLQMNQLGIREVELLRGNTGVSDITVTQENRLELLKTSLKRHIDNADASHITSGKFDIGRIPHISRTSTYLMLDSKSDLTFPRMQLLNFDNGSAEFRARTSDLAYTVPLGIRTDGRVYIGSSPTADSDVVNLLKLKIQTDAIKRTGNTNTTLASGATAIEQPMTGVGIASNGVFSTVGNKTQALYAVVAKANMVQRLSFSTVPASTFQVTVTMTVNGVGAEQVVSTLPGGQPSYYVTFPETLVNLALNAQIGFTIQHFAGQTATLAAGYQNISVQKTI